MCQKSSKSNIFDGKRASEAKNGETKKPNFDEMLDLLCFQWQSLGWKGAWEVETLHVPNQIFPLCVCQIHPSPTFLRVKGLARRKVVKPKSTGFTRCSTYSASNDKISGQKELKKLNLCMYLIDYFHYVCAKLHPNRTFLRVKGLARQKVVKPESKNFTRCSIYSASDEKISSQVELKEMKVCI